MKTDKQGKIILILSFPLLILLMIVSGTGNFTPGFYARESFNWQIQSVGQDTIDLFVIVPVLIITAIFAYRKNAFASLLWAGTILYILYTFFIYCFDVHFNKLFILYCFTFGLSVYSLLWFIFYTIKNNLAAEIIKKSVIRTTGIYFLIISLAFYFLWLSEIIPAVLKNITPKSLTEIGLFTNPVQVLDLSIFLPGIFLTGLLVLRRRSLGFLFSQVILAFFILMDITIGWLALLMKQKGLESNTSVTVIMAVLTASSLLVLIWNARNIKFK